MNKVEELEARIEAARYEIKKIKIVIEQIRYCASDGAGLGLDFAETRLNDILKAMGAWDRRND